MMNFNSFDPCVWCCFLMKYSWILVVWCMMSWMIYLIFISGCFEFFWKFWDEDLHSVLRVHSMSRLPANFARKRIGFLRIHPRVHVDYLWIFKSTQARTLGFYSETLTFWLWRVSGFKLAHGSNPASVVISKCFTLFHFPPYMSMHGFMLFSYFFSSSKIHNKLNIDPKIAEFFALCCIFCLLFFYH
jgi:hypothetical protein